VRRIFQGAGDCRLCVKRRRAIHLLCRYGSHSGSRFLLAGIALKSQPARFASAAVVILTVAKVFLYDLAGVQGVFRARFADLSRG
jgi:hypothetical protein